MNPFNIIRRVEFSDTDAAGLIHFSTYFRFMEAAEAEFFRSLGIKLLSESDEGFFGFPRVDVSCRFSKPLYFDDEVKIELSVESIEGSRINYAFKFLKEINSTWTKTARGKMAVAFVKKMEDGSLASHPIPPEWITRIENKLNA